MKIKKIITVITIVSLLLGYSVPFSAGGFVIAQTSPSEPSSPEQPAAPDQPDSPDQPSGPDEPESPDLPEDTSTGSSEQNVETPDTTTTDQTEGTNNTGSQDVNGNVGDTNVTTGDATATGALLTDTNLNTSTNPTAGTAGTSIVNEGNNSGSVNVSDVTQNSTSTINQDNNAVITNNADLSAVTGGNTVSNNMNGNVTIETGDANTALTVINQANTNIAGVDVVEFNVFDDQVGDVILDFSNPCATGSGCTAGTPVYVGNTNNNSDSTNTAQYTSDVNNSTFQNNDAVIENNIILNSDSGGNLATDNMNGDTNIKTGDANVSANVANLVNNNFQGEVYYGVVNVFGDLIGDIILATTPTTSTPGTVIDNSGNGSGSTNFANVDTSVSNDYTQNNNLNLDTNINATGTTGDNTASANMQGGQSIESGDASFTGQIFNVANNNVTGGDWWIVLVNDAGNWIGKIVGGQEGMNYAGSAGTEFIVNPDGSITAVNSGNNSGSTNTANVTQNTQNTVTQNNNASITNNLNLSGNTGGNTIQNSMNGGASVETGDVNIVASVVNFVNNNFSGGRVYMTVVNVLGGKWLGNFIAPGHTKEEALAQNPEPTPEPALGGLDNDPDEDSIALINPTTTKKTKKTIQSSTPTTTPVQSVLAAITGRSTSASGGSLVNPVIDGEEYDEAAALAGDIAVAKSKIRINLAWAIIIAPLLFAIPLAKRKLFAKLPSKKN